MINADEEKHFALSGPFERLFAILDPQYVVETLVHVACQEFQADHAAVVLYSPHGSADIAGRARAFGALSSNPTQRLLTAAAEIAADEPLRFTREGANQAGLRRLLRDEGIRTVCVAPLARDDVSGRLVLCWRAPAGWHYATPDSMCRPSRNARFWRHSSSRPATRW